MNLLRRHLPFYLALAAALPAGLVSYWFWPALTPVVAANAFFLTYLALTLAALPELTAAYLKDHAASGDEPVWIIFLITFAAVAVAMLSLFVALNGGAEHGWAGLSLTLAAVPLGWLTIHMMAAIHYSHEFWQPDGTRGDDRKARRGLDFPGTHDPAGIDFVYFAYVLGMTAQTSDIAITSTAMRRIVLLHSIASFFFNTVLVAAAVNAAVALGQ